MARKSTKSSGTSTSKDSPAKAVKKDEVRKPVSKTLKASDEKEEKSAAKTTEPAKKTEDAKPTESPETLPKVVEKPAYVDSIDDELAATSPLSSKVLTGLTLMVAGGILALWAGPKIAPTLPRGLSPVAEFFAPGQSQSKQQIESMRADFEDRLAGIANDDQKITAAIQQYDTGNAQEIQALKDQIAATDSKSIEARLATVETQLAGLSAEMQSLTGQLTEIDTEGGQVDQATAAKIASYAATIEGLKAELADMAAKQGSLDQKIDEVSVTSERKVEEAKILVASAEVQKGVSDLATALEAGTKFDGLLENLSSNGLEVPAALHDVAQTGVLTVAELQDSFSPAAHAALKASIKEDASDSISGRFSAFLKSQVTVRSLEPQDGDGTDAILSRVQGALDNNNLQKAVTEVDALSGAAKDAMSSWLQTVTQRLNAELALQTLSSALTN